MAVSLAGFLYPGAFWPMAPGQAGLSGICLVGSLRPRTKCHLLVKLGMTSLVLEIYHSFVHSLVRSFNHSFTQPFLHSFTTHLEGPLSVRHCDG